MLTLSTASHAVRGSAIRDLLFLTSRPEVVSLAGGLPAADLMPRERIAAAAATALTDPASVQYGETAGLPALREVLAAHETTRCGREVTGVVVTTGSQQALDLVARALLDPGDTVVVEDPAYVGALQVFQAAGAALHPVPLDGDGMQVDVLERRLRAGLRPRLVHTVSTFHNPRGVTLAPERRVRLAALAAEFGFLVVEDDPYGLLAFDGAPPPPVAAHSDRVVRLGSASKILAPALRVGWLHGPPDLTAAVERLKQCTDLCTSSLRALLCPWRARKLAREDDRRRPARRHHVVRGTPAPRPHRRREPGRGVHRRRGAAPARRHLLGAGRRDVLLARPARRRHHGAAPPGPGARRRVRAGRGVRRAGARAVGDAVLLCLPLRTGGHRGGAAAGACRDVGSGTCARSSNCWSATPSSPTTPSPP